MTFSRSQPGTYPGDQQWARKFEPETIRVLAPYMAVLMAGMMTWQQADTAEDRACIGDLRIDIGSIQILSRVRDGDCYQRDLTLRSWRANEVETEVSKILKGAGKWYFYGWAERRSLTFHEWMLIDLDRVRERQTIEHCRHREIPNTDQTTRFVHIPRASLEWDGAIRVQQKQRDGEISMHTDSGERWTPAACDEWLATHQLQEATA